MIFKSPKIIQEIGPILEKYGFQNKKKYINFRSIEEWEKEEKIWKEKHPILYILREFYYKLYRLWNHKISMIPRRIKWFFQRGKRGYSDNDVWNFDSYLAEVISKGCKQLAKEKHGYPSNLTLEKWEEILNSLSKKFEEYTKIIYLEEGYETVSPEEFDKKMDEMINLLKNHFTHLWD